jgi:hypothetical protein
VTGTVSLHRSLVCLATLLLLLAGATLAAPPRARASALSCALTSSPSSPFSASTPSATSPGCWTDVTPYPFGSDGNPVDPNSVLCDGPTPTPYGNQFGASWGGDFNSHGDGVTGNPPCFLQANSLAFRAWNRGLAATGQPTNNNDGPSDIVAFGVWLYNGSNWFPDPTFPGSGACPGSTILWAGKLDYWLIGSNASPQTTLCRFDGVNLEWEPLSLPAATVARLPTDSAGNRVGGITSGACYAWNNCWFLGDDGIEVHWDGQSLSNASAGVGSSPWLQGDFTVAVAGTDPSGHGFGLAVTKSTSTTVDNFGNALPAALPAAPDGSPPAQLFGSQGGPWAPQSYSPPATPLSKDPFTTDLTMISADSQGDVWVAGDPAARLQNLSSNRPVAPEPLERLTETGAQASCPGYGANTFTFVPPLIQGYTWWGLSTFPDGSALASAAYKNGSILWSDPNVQPPGSPAYQDSEPAIVHAACGQPPTVTEFRRPDPVVADQADAMLIPADFEGYATAVAANAPNDAWAATTDGVWAGTSQTTGQNVGGALAPHLYRWTDGQPPDAPAGDDNETRPSLFTLDAPVYTVSAPTVVVTAGTVTTTTTKKKPKRVKLAPAIYAIHSKLRRSPNGTYTLYLTFKVRRPVTIGLQALHGRKVVASTGLKRFRGHNGQLALRLDRKHWPTRLRLETPKPAKKS